MIGSESFERFSGDGTDGEEIPTLVGHFFIGHTVKLILSWADLQGNMPRRDGAMLAMRQKHGWTESSNLELS